MNHDGSKPSYNFINPGCINYKQKSERMLACVTREHHMQSHARDIKKGFNRARTTGIARAMRMSTRARTYEYITISLINLYRHL